MDISIRDPVIKVDPQFSRSDLRRIEIDRAKSLVVTEDEVAQRQVTIGISRLRREFQPDLPANQLEFLGPDFTRPPRIQINIDMFGDKILRAIANNDRCVGYVNSLGENIRQFDFLLWVRRTRTQRHLAWIQYDARGAHLYVLERTRNPMPQKSEEPVINPGEIDIDRFHVARSGRDGVQVPDSQIGKNAALRGETRL